MSPLEFHLKASRIKLEKLKGWPSKLRKMASGPPRPKPFQIGHLLQTSEMFNITPSKAIFFRNGQTLKNLPVCMRMTRSITPIDMGCFGGFNPQNGGFQLFSQMAQNCCHLGWWWDVYLFEISTLLC